MDRYEGIDIDDRESVPEMSRAARLAAEKDMQRRDKGLTAGRRAGRRDHMPAFLQSDDDDGEIVGAADGLLSGVNPNRRRRQYDEVPDMDDVEEEEVRLQLVVA